MPEENTTIAESFTLLKEIEFQGIILMKAPFFA
jgi:hypothetical protein